ncbi:MAG: extracellular solute-binding protein [Clostridia bacterium]|nr:extracellular solute-binding protein [Clostridia bacterium]
MKKIKKLISLLAIFTLVAFVFTGCGSNDTERTQTDGTSFTYWCTFDANALASGVESYADMLMFREMEKRTGVSISFEHPIQGSTGNEAFLTMLATSKRPDMIEYWWSNYTGGPQAAIDDQVIVCLDDYLKEYAPNFYDYMEGEKGKENAYRWKLQATTDEGSYYGFNVLNIGTTKGFAGLYVRADKLKDWGMEVPQTIDDWTALFAKAKTAGFQKPFVCDNNTLSFKSDSIHSFNTAFDVGKNLYVEDGKVVFAPFQKGYKEYVAQITEWIKAGYIDTGFPTNDKAKIEGNMANGISVATHGYVGSGIGKILPAVQNIDPNADFVACPYPVAKSGDKARFQMMYEEATDNAIAISTTCGNYEKAISWCDYRYCEEGSTLQIFGIEGDTFTVEERDGEKHFVYTDKILKPETSGVNSVTEALYKYMQPCNYPGLNQHPDYLDGYYPYGAQKDAIRIWNENSELAKEHKLPTLSFTEDERNEINDIKEIAEVQLEVDISDIMLGKKSIDTYDAAIASAKDNDYDRLIAIYQAAYDRYLSKLDV